jgi:transposase
VLGLTELSLLQELVAQTNDARLDEYTERLFALTGKRVSRSLMCRTLQRLKLRPKKRPFGRPSRSGPRSPPSARLSASR